MIRCPSLLVEIWQCVFCNFYSRRVLNSFLSVTVHGIESLYLLKFFIGIETHGMTFHYSAYSCLMCFHPCVFLVSLICELRSFVWCGVYLRIFSCSFRLPYPVKSLCCSFMFCCVIPNNQWCSVMSQKSEYFIYTTGKPTNSDLSFILITHKGSNVYAEKQHV